jgi:ribose-phosphate pyrophosphokinase
MSLNLKTLKEILKENLKIINKMKYERIKYPDGGVYAKITDFSNPVITERINTYEDLFFIKSLKEACDYNNVEGVILNVPSLFQQQHDRRFHENESFELKIVADFINSCNFKRVNVYHPHSDVSQIAINKFKAIDNSKFVIKVLEDIGTTPILLSTDAGSYKWINKLADVIEFPGEVYGANKSRDLETHKLTQVIDRQDFEGRDILILDDLSVFGGTFVGLAKLLKERNVGKLYLAVSHITVQNPNKELEGLYEKIYCVNTKYDSYDLSNIKVFDYNDLGIFGENKKSRYVEPIDSRWDDDIYTIEQWNKVLSDGWIHNDDGSGYWVKDGMKSSDEVFSTGQLDATHVVWYNK